MNLWDVTLDQLVDATQQDVAEFPLLAETWLPVMRRRLLDREDKPEDWLVNPLFRWWFLRRTDKLHSFENELRELVGAGIRMHDLAEKLMREVGTAPTSNRAHDRMLDARAEVRGLLHYARSAHQVALEPEQSGPAHDFNARTDHDDIAVEAKFVRRSDKLGAYLHRWLESQTELTGSDLFLFPLIHFDWARDLDQNELCAEEIAALNEFLRHAALSPRTPSTLSHGRVKVSFRYHDHLPLPRCGPPLDDATPLASKIEAKVQSAWNRQLVAPRTEGRPASCYVLVNVGDDADFYQRDRCQQLFESLTTDWNRRGLRLLIDPNAHYI